jgi:hypothetical protein
MCELLYCTRDKTHIDPDVDRRGCWKAGMIICVQDDGWEWSETERNSPDMFGILQLTGIPRADVEQKALEEEKIYIAGVGLDTYRRRRFKLNFVLLTPEVRANFKNVTIPNPTHIAAFETTLIDLAA